MTMNILGALVCMLISFGLLSIVLFFGMPIAYRMGCWVGEKVGGFIASLFFS